jgi:hypothetical protein
MDCREAQELLSAAQDREELHDSTAASVAAHCRTCPECGAFDVQLSALHDLGAPSAPEGLAERITAAIAEEVARDQVAAAEEAVVAAALLDAKAAKPGSKAPVLARLRSAGDANTPSWLTSGRLWIGTAAVTLSAAALVVAVVVTQQLADQSTVDRLAEDSIQRALGKAPSGSAPLQPGAAGEAAAPPAGAARIPDYVAYDSGVYAAAQSTDVTGSQLTTVGVVQSALNMGSIQSIPVKRSSSDSRAIFLVLPGGAHQRFDPVLRVRRGTTFQLRAGTSLQRYGQWPQLPPDLPRPTGKNGAPTFVASGTDDAGVAVYVRVGDTPERGFAIAPGTAAGDPAAGNPNWTWWLPIR